MRFDLHECQPTALSNFQCPFVPSFLRSFFRDNESQTTKNDKDFVSAVPVDSSDDDKYDDDENDDEKKGKKEEKKEENLEEKWGKAT